MTATLVEVRHAVFKFFLQENSINPATQHGLFTFDCDVPEVKVALIEAVLSDLEKTDMVRKVIGGDKTYWVLIRPLGMYEQSVSVSYQTALRIAETINKYCAQVGNTSNQSDASAIKESDLQKMSIILDNLLEASKTSP